MKTNLLGMKISDRSGLLMGLLAVTMLLNPQSMVAQAISSESFNYTAGTTIGGESPIGWGGAWTGSSLVTSGSLSYPASTGLTSSGNSLTVGGGASASIKYGAGLDFAMSGAGAGETLYASTLIDMTAGATGSSASGALDLSNGLLEWYFGINSSGNFFMKSGTTDSSGALVSTSGTVASLNTTYFLVSKLVTASNGNDTLYLNWYTSAGSVPTTDPGTWMLTLNVTGSTSTTTMKTMEFFSSTNSTYDLDEIKLGTSWASVAAVPEPRGLSFVFLGIGLLGCTLIRRGMHNA